MSILTDTPTELEATALAYRVPRVDLMPPEVVEERAVAKAKVVSAIVVGSCVVIVAAAAALCLYDTHRTETQVQDAESRQGQLRTEQARYSEVPVVLAKVDAAKKAQEHALAMDVQWYRYLNEISMTYPESVWLKSVTFTVGESVGNGGAPANGGVTGAQTTTPTQTTAGASAGAAGQSLLPAGVGKVSFTGNAYTHSDVGSWIDVVNSTPGFVGARFSGSTLKTLGNREVAEFSGEWTLLPDVFSKRYQRKAG